MKERTWRDDALCKGTDPALWYPDDEYKVESPEYDQVLSELKDICAQCPVRLQCLEASLSGPEGTEFGVWGGLDEAERKRLT